MKALIYSFILFKFGKLPPKKSHKGNRTLAGLTCSFRNYKNLIIYFN